MLKDLILNPLYLSVGVLAAAGVLNACIDEINTRFQHQYLTYCQAWFSILIFLSQLILNVYVTLFLSFITLPLTISELFRNNINTIQIFNDQHYDSYTYGCVCALILLIYLIYWIVSTINDEDPESNIKTVKFSKDEIFSAQPGLESIGDLPDVDTLEIDIEKPDVKIIKLKKDSIVTEEETNDLIDPNETEEEPNDLIDPNETEEETNDLNDPKETEEEPNDLIDPNEIEEELNDLIDPIETEEEPNDLIDPNEIRVTWAEPVETNKDNKLQLIIHNAIEYYIDEQTNKVYTDNNSLNLVGEFTKDGKLVLINQSHLIKEEF